MKQKYTIIGIVVAIVAVLAILQATGTVNILPKKELKPVTLRLNWLNQAQFAGFYAAKEKGFFEDQGLDVTIKEYEEGLDQTAEVAKGNAEFGVSTSMEIIGSIAAGNKVKALYAIHQTSPAAFVSLKSSNITTPADFKGKVLGAKGGNKEAQIRYNALLKAFNIGPKSVTFKDLDYELDEAGDLSQDRADVVDIYRTELGYKFDQANLEYNLIKPENFGIGSYGDVLVASDALINEQPEVAQAFVDASIEGWEYAFANFDEALTITAKYENEIYKNEKLERSILTETYPLTIPSGAGKFGDMNFVTWNEVVKALQADGEASNVNPRDVYTVKFITK